MKNLSSIKVLLALLPLCLPACVVDESDLDLGSTQEALDNSPAPSTELRDFARGTMVVMDPIYEQELVDRRAAEGAIAAGTTTLVYMNRTGGVFSPGGNDSSTNRSSLVKETVNFPAADLSDGDWTQVMSCVRQQFSRFNIEVTDVDPGSAPHFESVIGGSPQLIGMDAGVGGVSPFTSACDMIPNSIVFSFTDVLPRDPQIICEVAAQEIAHSFGLDHEYLCSDPMTYLTGCGAKGFQDVAAPCGEGSARACAVAGKYDCGYTEQNSVQRLTQRLGLKEGGNLSAPAISSPSDGDEVGLGFEVRTEISGSATVEFRIDGNTIATLSSGPYYFSTPSDLALGTHILEIVATQNAVTTTDSISITVVNSGSPGGEGGGTGPDGSESQVTGGCSTGGSGSGSLLLLLLGVFMVTLRRRSQSA